MQAPATRAIDGQVLYLSRAVMAQHVAEVVEAFIWDVSVWCRVL